MRFPDRLLDLLIDHDAFRVCRLMSTREFVRYCKARNVEVDVERLRHFERIGVFRPLLRAFRPEVTYKIEGNESGWRYAGAMSDGEDWSGETRTEVLEFDPRTAQAREWRAEGLLWVPGQGEWLHEDTIDTKPTLHEAYFSRFQLLPLDHVATMLTMKVHLEWATAVDGTPNFKWSPRLRNNAATWGRKAAAALRGPRDEDVIAVLFQLIANRFYYKTQSDGRQMTIGQFPDWEWGDYARTWRAEPFTAGIQLEENRSREFFEWLDIRWTHIDPVSRWYNLARFVRIDKRELLKGDALRGLAVREMAQMLRLFHKEAFGKDLRPLGEVGVHVIKRIPDVDPELDPMRALELSANDYGVNGKPQLVLFVEGETEQTVLPVIFERLWGAPASRYGIEISSLGGVDNAAGGKEAPFSALWRLVDYLHHHQTLAFVLLDDEGFATRNVRDGLRKANSVHSADRKATRRDHIKVWKTSFELENFSDTEIALALNRMAARKAFARADVAACRAAAVIGPVKGRRMLTIDRMFQERMGVALDKPGLGLVLADVMLDPSTRRRPSSRPITRFLVRVAQKASGNFQPVTQADWETNQRSGYLGALQPAAKLDRRRRQDGRRRRQRRAPDV